MSLFHTSLLLSLLACETKDTPATTEASTPSTSDSSAPVDTAPPGDTNTTDTTDTTDDTGHPLSLPAHNDCLPHGETYSEEVCLAVVEADGRYPGVSENKSGTDPDWSDPRLSDPDIQWLTDQTLRCACACCHIEAYQGPGVYFWALDYDPVWLDSASAWSLTVFAGWTEEYEQTLPSDDPERLQAIIQAELDRRDAE